MAPEIRSHLVGADSTYYSGQKILAVIVCQFKKKIIVIRTLLSS
jgi:hypothetical protein